MLNDNEEIVLKTLTEWSKWDYDGAWFGYSQLSDETSLPVGELKKICKKLCHEGLVELQPTYDDDRIVGRGYFIKSKNTKEA